MKGICASFFFFSACSGLAVCFTAIEEGEIIPVGLVKYVALVLSGPEV